MKKKNKGTGRNHHHIIPRSRLIGVRVIVPIADHRLYHQIFGNMIPIEIVDYLNENFWGDNYSIQMEEKDGKN